MNKILIITFLLSGNLMFGQSRLTKQDYRDSQDRWVYSAGINALVNLGTKNPLERIDDFAFKQPLAIAVEYRWANLFAVEQDFSFNGYESQTRIDNGILQEDILYFTTNTSFKFYYSDYLFDLYWLDLYTSTGLGVFIIDEFNTSANVSLGALFWLNDTRTLGVRVQSTGKFAFNAKNKQYDNNHIQHFLQVVFKL